MTDGDDCDMPSIMDYTSGVVDIDTESMVTAAAEKAVEEMTEHLEYELRGAWRAGYDYLHVYDELFGVGGYDPDLSLTQYVYPAYEGDPRPDPPALVYRYSYDLTSVPDDVIRAAVRGELDAAALEDLRR